MKSVGLLTFHYPINYGALLQTYATVKKLESFGLKVTVINYYSKEQISHYDYFKKPQSLKNFIYYLVKTLFFKSFLTKKSKFETFRNKYFKLTSRFETLEAIDYSSYDFVLTGSDQVFNLSKRDRLPYFQPFQKKKGQKKLAFAPSFGISEFDKETIDLIRKNVIDFDSLSCREVNGATLLGNLTGGKVENVLDPVFLLSSDDWSIIVDKRIVSEDYIFIYDLNGKDALVKIALEIKKTKNIKIVMISNDPVAPARKIYKGVDVILQSAGIEDFMNLIKYSTFIVTDSFHGTAFSIIFRKDFYTFIALEKASGRIDSLLSQFNISDRTIRKGEMGTVSSAPVNYDNELIEAKVLDSSLFLKRIVS